MVNEAWAAVIAYGWDTELVDDNIGAAFLDIACVTIDDMIYEVHASHYILRTGKYHKLLAVLARVTIPPTMSDISQYAVYKFIAHSM